MQSVVMLNAFRLSVDMLIVVAPIMLSVIMLSVTFYLIIMPNVIMVNVVMLSVVAPWMCITQVAKASRATAKGIFSA